MLHLKFLSILLRLLLLVHSIKDCSSAHACQETTRSGLAASDQGYIVSASEELDGVARISIRKPWLERRKMAARKVTWKEFRKDQEQVKEKGTSEISGATHSDGKCDFEGRGDFCVKRNFEDRSSSADHKIKAAAGFVAFNADYHGPTRHPPKHN